MRSLQHWKVQQLNGGVIVDIYDSELVGVCLFVCLFFAQIMGELLLIFHL